jgi:hypothetical protein
MEKSSFNEPERFRGSASGPKPAGSCDTLTRIRKRAASASRGESSSRWPRRRLLIVRVLSCHLSTTTGHVVGAGLVAAFV